MLSCTALVHAYVPELDVTYDTINRTKLQMDVFSPQNPTSDNRPALLYVHGGCWNAGSRKDIPEEFKKMADEGLTVFSVGYRLSTIAKYPAAVTDVQQAIRFIRKNAKRFQVNPDQIIVHGESAGGYLAAIMGVRSMPDRKGKIDRYSNRVQLVSDWYGRTDFTASQTTGFDCAVDFLGMPRNSQTMEHFHKASVMTDINKDSADFLIVHGTSDEQVYPIHSTYLANKLWSEGKKAELYFNENQGHAFSRQIPWALTRSFILKYLGRKHSFANETPFYVLDYDIKANGHAPGKFDLNLVFGQGPQVKVLHQASSPQKGRVGVITKSKVFNLEVKDATLDVEWSYTQVK